MAGSFLGGAGPVLGQMAGHQNATGTGGECDLRESGEQVISSEQKNSS